MKLYVLKILFFIIYLEYKYFFRNIVDYLLFYFNFEIIKLQIIVIVHVFARFISFDEKKFVFLKKNYFNRNSTFWVFFRFIEYFCRLNEFWELSFILLFSSRNLNRRRSILQINRGTSFFIFFQKILIIYLF